MKWDFAMKIPKPPSWEMIRVINGIAVIFCSVTAITADNHWVAIINAFLAGANLAAIGYTFMFIALRKSFDGLVESFNEMSDLNQALIENRVQFHISGMVGMPGDDNETRPKLH